MLIPSTSFVRFVQDLKYQYENINLKIRFILLNILFFLVYITYKASKRTFERTFELGKSIFLTCLAGK